MLFLEQFKCLPKTQITAKILHHIFIEREAPSTHPAVEHKSSLQALHTFHTNSHCSATDVQKNDDGHLATTIQLAPKEAYTTQAERRSNWVSQQGRSESSTKVMTGVHKILGTKATTS